METNYEFLKRNGARTGDLLVITTLPNLLMGNNGGSEIRGCVVKHDDNCFEFATTLGKINSMTATFEVVPYYFVNAIWRLDFEKKQFPTLERSCNGPGTEAVEYVRIAIRWQSDWMSLENKLFDGKIIRVNDKKVMDTVEDITDHFIKPLCKHIETLEERIKKLEDDT